jgi:hypothetical protein
VKKFILFLVSFMLILNPFILIVADDTITDTPGSIGNKRTIKRVFKDYAVADKNYDYDDQGGSDVDDGIIYTQSFWQASKVAQISVTVTDVTSITVVIEGMLHPDLTSWSEIWVREFTVSTGENQDVMVVITEPLYNVRIGNKFSGGTPDATGQHDGGDDQTILTDSGESWTIDQWIDYYILNIDDGSSGIITDNDAITVTAIMTGGIENDWDDNDDYEIFLFASDLVSATVLFEQKD